MLALRVTEKHHDRELEAFSRVSVVLDFISLKEGLYDVSGVKLYDKISGHEYHLPESFFIWSPLGLVDGYQEVGKAEDKAS